MVSDLTTVPLVRFFDFMMTGKRYALGRPRTPSSERGCVPGLAIGGLLLPRDAGRWPQLPAATRSRGSTADGRHPSAPPQPSRLSLAGPRSGRPRRESTLSCQIGFVLQDSARRRAHVSALSTLPGAALRPAFARLGVRNACLPE